MARLVSDYSPWRRLANARLVAAHKDAVRHVIHLFEESVRCLNDPTQTGRTYSEDVPSTPGRST
jgi:hypothetical protein